MYGCGLRFAPVFLRAAAWLRKARPTIWPNSGMRFPAEAPNGNCDPVWGLKTGCSFRLINPSFHSAINMTKGRPVRGGPIWLRVCLSDAIRPDGRTWGRTWLLVRVGCRSGGRISGQKMRPAAGKCLRGAPLTIVIVYQMPNQQKTVERPVPAGHASCGGCVCVSLLWVRCQRCLFELRRAFCDGCKRL